MIANGSEIRSVFFMYFKLRERPRGNCPESTCAVSGSSRPMHRSQRPSGESAYLYSLTRQFVLSESVLVENPKPGVSHTESRLSRNLPRLYLP